MILEGRAALVTGARRVGGTVTVELARRGADVALSYNRSREAAEATAEAVRALGRRAIVRQADLTSAAECKTLVDSVAQDLGRLDVLVNMASTYESVPLEALTPERFQHSLDVELKATLALSLAAIPHMREAGGGRIVNFSDWLAASGRPRYKGYLAYYVAKKAVAGLTEALALELAGDQILVTAVAPGPILAPPGLAADEYESVEKATPLGRWGGPGEIAKAVLALIESDFVTGEIVRVDGGRHLR